jgi:hypothetical protein
VKIDPNLKNCVFGGYTKGIKGFNLWDPISKKMAINKDFVFNE